MGCADDPTKDNTIMDAASLLGSGFNHILCNCIYGDIMKDSDNVQIHYDGKINRGQRAKMIGWLEALGHAALRAEESPHQAFQAAEYLKRGDQ